jgi:hypothetical protein
MQQGCQIETPAGHSEMDGQVTPKKRLLFNGLFQSWAGLALIWVLGVFAYAGLRLADLIIARAEHVPREEPHPDAPVSHVSPRTATFPAP